MPDVSKVKLPNSSVFDIISKTGRGVVRCETASTSTATAFIVTAPGITELYDGIILSIKNTVVTSATNCTLNLNSLGAKRIWLSLNNSYCTSHWAKNATYLFIYDATNTRWELQQGRDDNSNTIGEYAGSVTAGGGNMARYSLIMQTQLDPPTFASLVTTSSTATTKDKQTCGFIPNGKVLYQSAGTYAVGETAGQSGVWVTASLDLRYSFNITTTTFPATDVGKSIYIKCTLNSTDGQLYLADTTWWATELPTTQDNFYYVYVGQLYSRYLCTLYPTHPIYYHDGTEIKEYSEYGGEGTTYTFADGTNGFTVTPSGGTAQTVSVTSTATGSTDTSSKLFLVGATSQTASSQTYSQDTIYAGTDGHVYSNSKQVVNLSDTQALTNKTYNGYTLGAACAKAVATTVTSGNSNLVTSGGVYDALSTVAVTIPANGWIEDTTNNYYYNDVTVSGVTASDNYEIIGFIPSNSTDDNYLYKLILGAITYGITSADQIKFIAFIDEAPPTDVSIVIREVLVNGYTV